MIEINLVPDIKREYLQAKRVRTVVISSTIFVGIVSVGIVILLAVYLFGVQTVRSNLADDQIKQKSKEFAGINDIEEVLTIQQQLKSLSQLHDQKNIDSRFFSLLTAINPAPPNKVSFSIANIDADTQTIHLEAQAVSGYDAAETLKKTILSTTLSYKDSDGTTQKKKLTDNVAVSSMNYGDDSSGGKVLRFTMDFNYDPALLAFGSKDAVIMPPNQQVATDSFLRLPESLFDNSATENGDDR